MSKVVMSYGDCFCTACGANLEKDADKCPKCGAPYDARFRYGGTSAIGAGGVGWSDKVNDASFKRNRKKNRKGTFIFLLIVCAIIFVVMVSSGDIDLDDGGWGIFGGVMAILWSFWFLWGFIQSRTGKDWEGTVTKKDREVNEYTRKDDNGYRTKHTQVCYRVFFRTDSGRKKTLTQYDNSAWYDYFKEGDKVRYHGRPMAYYEKYDKSKDDQIPCASCGSMRDAREDYCGKCGAAILKASSNAMSRQGVTYEHGVQPRPKVNPVPASPVRNSTIVYEDETPPAPKPTAAKPVSAPTPTTAEKPVSAPKPTAPKPTSPIQPKAVNFCPNCGKKVAAGAKFCTECGTKL